MCLELDYLRPRHGFSFRERFLESNLENVFPGSYIPAVRRDAVDAIIEQWRVECPNLEPAPMGVFGRIARLSALAGDEIERVFRRHGLTGADFDVLATLRRAGPPYRLTPTTMSRSTMVSSGGMTKRLNRLEARGLVRREPAPDDRRSTLVALTETGRDLVDATVVEHLENEERLLAVLPASDRDTLVELLRGLLLGLERD